MKLHIGISLNCSTFHGARYHLFYINDREYRWYRPYRPIYYRTPWYKAIL